jgi:plasmid maintenance system antidote protein VapI
MVFGFDKISNVKNHLEFTRQSSNWLKESEEWERSLPWLRRSQAIAILVLKTIKAKGISQKDLAEMLGVSAQQVSKIVKGKENLTLSTISNLEQVLGVELIQIPTNDYKISNAQESKAAEEEGSYSGK